MIYYDIVSYYTIFTICWVIESYGFCLFLFYFLHFYHMKYNSYILYFTGIGWFFFAYLLRSSYLTFEKASFKYSLFKATWNTKLVMETSQMRHKRYRYAMIDEIRHRFFVFILLISQPSQTTRDSVNQASRTEVKSPHPLHPCTSQPHV